MVLRYCFISGLIANRSSAPMRSDARSERCVVEKALDAWRQRGRCASGKQQRNQQDSPGFHLASPFPAGSEASTMPSADCIPKGGVKFRRSRRDGQRSIATMADDRPTSGYREPSDGRGGERRQRGSDHPDDSPIGQHGRPQSPGRRRLPARSSPARPIRSGRSCVRRQAGKRAQQRFRAALPAMGGLHEKVLQPQAPAPQKR